MLSSVTVGVSTELKTVEGVAKARTPATESLRKRIYAALAEVIAERGYRDASSTDVIDRADILPEAFFDLFPDKEACFIEAYEETVTEAVYRTVEAASEAVGSWQDQVRAALRAFLEYVAENPTLARMCLVETLGAGPAQVTRYEDTIRRFAALFEAGREQSEYGEALPESTEEMLVGGLFWVVHTRIINHDVERIESLLPELTHFALAPYMGSSEARRYIAATMGE